MKKADYIKAFKEACQLARRHRDYPAPPAPTGNMLADMMSLEAWRTGAAKQAAAKHEEREKRFFENNPNFAPRFPRFGPGLAEAGGPGAGADGATGAKPAEPSKDAEQNSKNKYQWLAEAMLLVQEHPELSDAKIARKIGKHPSTLSRNATYRRAAGKARAVTVPKGYKNSKTGQVEAVAPQ